MGEPNGSPFALTLVIQLLGLPIYNWATGQCLLLLATMVVGVSSGKWLLVYLHLG